MKKRLSVVILLVFVIQIFLSVPVFATDNSVTRLNNCEPEKIGDWLYYVKGSYNYSLFKIGAKGTESEVAKEYAGYAVALGDKIFYPNPEDGNKIYSVKQDGTENKIFLDQAVNLISGNNQLLYAKYAGGSSVVIDSISGKVTELLSKEFDIYSVSDQYLYYRDEKIFYKSKLDGTGAVELPAFSNNEKFICQIDGDTFYYVYKDKLYRSNPENTNSKKLADGGIYNLVIRNSKIFYKDPKTNYVYMMSKDGKEKKLLLKDDVWFTTSFDTNVYLNGAETSYKITPDGKKITKINCKSSVHFGSKYGIYFVKPNETYGFARMKADGSEDTVLLKDRVYNGQIKNGKLYYANEGGLYAVDLDGKNPTQLFKGYVYDFTVKDNWIFLYNDGNIYNLSLDGKVNSSTKVGSYITYFGEDVYFLGFESNGLYKVPMSGGTPTEVDKNYCSDLSVEGNALYYVTDNKLMKVEAGAITGKLVLNVTGFGGIYGDFIKYYNSDLNATYVMRLDGSGKTEYKYNENYVSGIDGWEYYTNSSDKNFLYKRQLDGSKPQLVLSEPDIKGIFIRDGVLFAEKDGNQIFMVLKDGTKKPLVLKDCNIYTIKMLDGYLYYQTFRFDAVDNKIYKLN